MKIFGTILVILGYAIGIVTITIPLVGLINAWMASDFSGWWADSRGIMIPGLIVVCVLFAAGYIMKYKAARIHDIWG